MTPLDSQLQAVVEMHRAVDSAEMTKTLVSEHGDLCEAGEWARADAKALDAASWFEAHLAARQRAFRLLIEARG